MDLPTTPRLLDRVRDRVRVKHYSIRTEQAYVDWIRRFLRFHGKRHPAGLGPAEVEAFLTHLAVAGNVAAATWYAFANCTSTISRWVAERSFCPVHWLASM